MDPLHLQKSLRNAKIGRGVLAVTVGVLIVSNTLLVGKLYSSSNQVVLVPTSVSDGMVARGSVDKRYVEALALDAVYGLYNSSPNSLSYGRAVIERLASVGERVSLLKHYDAVATDISERDISTVFWPSKIEHNHDRLEVVVEGSLETYLNTVPINREPRRILLGFKIEAGSVRLKSISKLENET